MSFEGQQEIISSLGGRPSHRGHPLHHPSELMGVASAKVSFSICEDSEGLIDVPPPPMVRLPDYDEPFELKYQRLFRLGQRHFSLVHFDPMYYVNAHVRPGERNFNFTDDQVNDFLRKLEFCISHYTPGYFIDARFGRSPEPTFFTITSDEEKRLEREYHEMMDK